MGADFTIRDVLEWARTRPADEEYDYTSCRDCALGQFLRETGRASCPSVGPFDYIDDAGDYVPLPADVQWAVAVRDSRPVRRWTFGGLVSRLEKLCPDTPSEWTKLDTYMADIEQVSAQ